MFKNKKLLTVIEVTSFFLAPVLLVIASSGCSGQDKKNDVADTQSPQLIAKSEVSENRSTLACSFDGRIPEYMGTYQIVSIDKYGGSLSSEIEAKKRIGGKVVLTPESFKSMWNAVEIQRPKYAMSCYPARTAEGEVPVTQWGGHWSNFYGFGAERSVINVLEIHDATTATGDPDYWYEVVLVNNKQQLWNMYDGWLYKLDKLN